MRNAIIHANHRMLLDQVDSRGWAVRDKIRKLRVPIEFWIETRAIRSGIEPIRV